VLSQRCRSVSRWHVLQSSGHAPLSRSRPLTRIQALDVARTAATTRVPPAQSDSGMSGATTDKPNVGTTPAALLELGGACDGVSQCASGKCQDGVCCESQECGTCYRCDRTGHCARVFSGKDPNTCDGAQYCDGRGVCVNIRGTPCSNSSECGTDQCIDGVCCEARCGVCSTCGYTEGRNETNKGTCLLVDGDDADSCTGTRSCVRGTCTSIDSQSLPLAESP